MKPFIKILTRSPIILPLFLDFARPSLIELESERYWVEAESDVIQSTQRNTATAVTTCFRKLVILNGRCMAFSIVSYATFSRVVTKLDTPKSDYRDRTGTEWLVLGLGLEFTLNLTLITNSNTNPNTSTKANLAYTFSVI